MQNRACNELSVYFGKQNIPGPASKPSETFLWLIESSDCFIITLMHFGKNVCFFYSTLTFALCF